MVAAVAGAANATSTALAMVGGDNGVRGPGTPLSLSPAQWLAIAIRPAADGAAKSLTIVATQIAAPDRAEEIANLIEPIFPADPAVLDAIVRFHLNGRFNNQLVDKYQRRIRGLVTNYPPAMRREARWSRGDRAEKIATIKQVAFAFPFDLSALQTVASYLESIEEYALAADYYHLCVQHAPNDWDSRLSELWCRAVAEDRLMTSDEIRALEAAVPADAGGRDELLAGAFRSAGETTKALDIYERLLKVERPTDTDPYYRASWLARLIGEPDRAVAILNLYTKVDPSSLRTCNIINEISSIEECRGDIAAALQAWKRVDAIKSGVGGRDPARGLSRLRHQPSGGRDCRLPAMRRALPERHHARIPWLRLARQRRRIRGHGRGAKKG